MLERLRSVLTDSDRRIIQGVVALALTIGFIVLVVQTMRELAQGGTIN